MSEFVADAHALYWHLLEAPNLSAKARRVLSEADLGDHRIVVPGIALVELVYLIERGRVPPEPLDEIMRRVARRASSYVLATLDVETVRALRRVPRSFVPDMPDRIITATALQLGLPLITRDEAIRRSGVVPVVW